MADADVNITPGSGVKVDTRTVGAGTDEHRQVMVIGDPTTAANVATVDAAGGANVRQEVAGTATLANVNDAATSTTLVAANTARLGLILYNDSTVACYVKYGSAASATSFTVFMGPQAYWEMPIPIYTGLVAGLWTSDASGAMRATELTA